MAVADGNGGKDSKRRVKLKAWNESCDGNKRKHYHTDFIVLRNFARQERKKKPKNT